MNFQEFRSVFFDQICFNVNQVYAWKNNFDKNNFGRWVERGYLIKLRNAFYMFSDYSNLPDINFFIANRIYNPSYISLHTALSYYGLIPESIVQVTSVSTLKTNSFESKTATYSYKSIKSDLFFGYNQQVFHKNYQILIASPEKALIDLLYLYPFYNSNSAIQDLRLDETILIESLNFQKLHNYLKKTKNKSLEKRMKVLISTYDLKR